MKNLRDNRRWFCGLMVVGTLACSHAREDRPDSARSQQRDGGQPIDAGSPPINTSPVDADMPRDDATDGGVESAPTPDAGSNTPNEQVPKEGTLVGDLAPCELTVRKLAALDTRSDKVSASSADLLALANKQREVPIHWAKRESGPTFDTSAETLLIEVTARSGPATEYVCDAPDYPETYRPKPKLELPIILTLRTGNGALDARIETVLVAESGERAEIPSLELPAEAVGGELGQATAAYYQSGNPSLIVELTFRSRGTYGWIGGPFSPNRTTPCAYTEYAYWPPSDGCWPRPGEPSEDVSLITSSLERLNRSFELSWDGGDTTRAKLEVELADGPTCLETSGITTHPVRVHMTSEDGRVDLRMDAHLFGGPSTIDPWPAPLADVTPFTLDLNGAIALDANGLKEQLGLSDPSVSAAIVSFYMSSPVTSDSPVLGGRLRAVAIDRTGFDTALPEVTLPGGDSEQCFSTGGETELLVAGTLAQR